MLPLQVYGKFPGKCHVIIREKLQTIVVCSSKSSWTSASPECQRRKTTRKLDMEIKVGTDSLKVVQ